MIDRIVVWALTLRERARSERGQDIMEYAIITGAIALALFAAVALFTDDINKWFKDMGDWLTTNVLP